MIDVDQLERDIDATDGDAVAFRKDSMRELIAEVRRGNAAVRALTSACGAATVAIAIAGVRVSDGYRGADQHLLT